MSRGVRLGKEGLRLSIYTEVLTTMKITACLLGALLVASGCGKQDKKRIAVIPKGRAHLFWQSVHAGAVAASRETNVEIIWNGPATETDYTGQLQIVDAMINQRRSEERRVGKECRYRRAQK